MNQLAIDFAPDPKRTALCFVDCRPDLFRSDFKEWLEKPRNFQVWLAFEKEANRLWNYGRRRYSQRTIFEYLRHETAVREHANVNGWKLNDWYVKDLARLYICFHPDRDGFFEFRNGQSAVRAA